MQERKKVRVREIAYIPKLTFYFAFSFCLVQVFSFSFFGLFLSPEYIYICAWAPFSLSFSLVMSLPTQQELGKKKAELPLMFFFDNINKKNTEQSARPCWFGLFLLAFFPLFVPLYICESRFWLDPLLLEHKKVNKKWNKQTKTKKNRVHTLGELLFFSFLFSFLFFLWIPCNTIVALVFIIIVIIILLSFFFFCF